MFTTVDQQLCDLCGGPIEPTANKVKVQKQTSMFKAKYKIHLKKLFS